MNSYIKQLEKQIENLQEELSKKQNFEDIDKLIKHINDHTEIRVSREILHDVKAMQDVNIMREIIELCIINILEGIKTKSIPREFEEDFKREYNKICCALHARDLIGL